MASANEFLGLLHCTIVFSTKEGDEYEGVVKQVFPDAKIVVVGKLILLPKFRMGTLNFGFPELLNIRVISRPNVTKERNVKKKDVPIYPKTDIEKLFDFDAGSDIEDDECANNQPAAYEMKVFPRLSKFVPTDFEILDSFNTDFNLAIKHIRRQDVIGVSLDGIKIGRSGTLTWLSISTKVCNFMFDILALGRKAFHKGLKSILEDGRIQKIFHDSRLSSDCLFHKYGVRLVNVFDTQVADYLVMMQMNQKDQIGNRVNTLDACLNYYLEVPCEYLYGPVNFDEKEDSLKFHALRPLQHDIQDVLIKNVMYLHLLKRELDLALMIPLRRATDVYLNCIQKLTEKELSVVPHNPKELPLDMHLDGMQIFRYKDFEYACSTVASGPPYREINNPFMNYLNYQPKYKNGRKEDGQSIVNKEFDENIETTSSELHCKTSVDYLKDRKSTCKMKGTEVNTFDRPSESDQDSSNDSEKIHKYKCCPTFKAKSDNNTSTSQNIVKSEASQCSGPPTVTDSGLREMLKRMSRKNLERFISDKPNECVSQISSGNVNVGDKPLNHSSDNNESSSFKFPGNSLVSNNTPKPESSVELPRPSLVRKSHSELLEIFSKMKSSTSSTGENSTTDNAATFKSVPKITGKASKDIDSVKSISSEELTTDTEVKADKDISDEEFEIISARVRARGALLRNRKTECSASDRPSTCNSFKSAQIKPKETVGISSGNVEPTSEDVTLYYSDTLKNPSKLVVTVKHKSTCLEDLYREAGDHSIRLWNEDNSSSVPNSSSNKPNETIDTADFWASVLGDRSSQPMSEKLRARLVPAGMAGY